MAFDRSYQLTVRIDRLTNVLKPLGLTIPDAPATDDPIIPEVTLDDIAEAVAAAKDPAADKTVQRLVTAHQLGTMGIASELKMNRVKAHETLIRAEIPTLLEQVRDIFHDAAGILEENGAPLRQHEDLGAVDLQALPLHSANAAQEALGACRTMATARTAWVALSTHGGPVGHAAHWSDYAAPTNEEYRAARDARPQLFPKATPWSVFRKGWTLDLPQTVKAAQQRRADYQSTAAGTDQARARQAVKVSLLGGGSL